MQSVSLQKRLCRCSVKASGRMCSLLAPCPSRGQDSPVTMVLPARIQPPWERGDVHTGPSPPEACGGVAMAAAQRWAGTPSQEVGVA